MGIEGHLGSASRCSLYGIGIATEGGGDDALAMSEGIRMRPNRTGDGSLQQETRDVKYLFIIYTSHLYQL